MTSPVTKVHPMIAAQVKNAGIKGEQIEAVAAHLGDLMKAIHGGDWRVNINHDTCFVVVSRDFSREGFIPVDKSNNGDN